jgi:hypothetical protein
MNTLNTLNYRYPLYENNIQIKVTYDLLYAMKWLLTNLLKKNYNVFMIIQTYSNNEEETMNEGIIKYDGEYIIKTFDFNDTYTVYSPYDTTLFYHTHISNMYKMLLSSSNISYGEYIKQEVKSEVKSDVKSEVKQEVTPVKVSKVKELEDVFSSVIKKSEELKKISSSLNKNMSDKKSSKASKTSVTSVTSDSDSSDSDSSDSDISVVSSDDSISSEDLDKIQKELDTMLANKVNIDNLVKEKDEELVDLRCEASFNNRKIEKTKQKEIEKKNIFRSDLNIYKKINNDNIKNEVDFIPNIFEAKYYVINFLDTENIIESTDYDNPSDELFELYTILYNARYNEDYDIPEEFDDIITKYISSLPDKSILTESELINILNDKCKHNGMFSQNEVEETLS